MGLLISRFRRKKSTFEILERLDSKIKNIERDGEDTEKKHKKIIGYVMAFSIGIYILFAVLYYFMYIGRSQYWVHTILYATPLLVLPFLVILLRSSISWYYNWSLEKNRSKLISLRNEKKKIIEEVKNTETYKVASEILAKFGTMESKPLKSFVPSVNVPGNLSTIPAPCSTPGQIRQRQLAIQHSTPINRTNNSMAISPLTPLYKGPNSVKLPRPLLSNSRSGLDKLMDYIVKDGPNYRMALICKECNSHNGMAMIEEFDYMSYVCAYCGVLNAARKARPAAPPLRPPLALTNSDADSQSPSSGSDSEDEGSQLRKSGSENGLDRPPSPIQAVPKSNQEKKED